jgi:alkylation response protein AidB-like acyl-CoA dehydrogenase
MSQSARGGSYLIEKTDPKNVFTPEDLDDEHRLIADTVAQFLDEKIFPRMDEIDAKKEGLMRELLVEAGELGLLGADIPEEYGGTETDEICSTIIAEKLGATGAFAIGHGGHCGIGGLPIIFFGNAEQQSRFLPAIATAEKVSAYALTEPGSGSDALSATTRAVLSDDGTHYLLNGGKTFISNGGIADMFIVYAKIEGEQFSAFIVDAHAEGLTTGPEEVKMGLKGSSTTPVYFDNVHVPVENLLHEAGKGHEVAFNILNIGRHKAAANSVGAAKYALGLSAAYANERKQFKVPIAQFGLIKEKIAEMAIRTYAMESVVYRTAGLLTEMINNLDRSGPDSGRVTAKGIAEYAMECSLEKVFASEIEGFVVDEAVQIHGGYGYIAEYPVERLYRDARIRRIFEGTNEINRILIPTTLLRRASKGDFPLMEAIKDQRETLAGGTIVRENTPDIVQAIKDVFLFILGVSVERYGKELNRQQEILGRLADLAIYAYAAESSWLRVEKTAASGGQSAKHKSNMAMAFVYGAVEKAALAAKEVITTLATGSELVRMQDDLDKLLSFTPVDIISLRKKIAGAISAAGKYVA